MFRTSSGYKSSSNTFFVRKIGGLVWKGFPNFWGPTLHELSVGYSMKDERWKMKDERWVVRESPPTGIVVPRLSSKTGGGESLVTFLPLAVPIRLQYETTCTHNNLSTQQNLLTGKWTYISADYTSKVGEKQFLCGRDASPESLRSKFTLVGLRDRLAHRTSQLRVYMCNVRHGI